MSRMPLVTAIAVVLVSSAAIAGSSPRMAVAEETGLRAGVATRDITPKEPVWLSGYAARNKASTSVATHLAVTALVLEEDGGDRVVLVALDNCEVTGEFMAPVLARIEREHDVPHDAVIVVSSHTHSAPVLDSTLPGMFTFDENEEERVHRYSEFLRDAIADVVGDALKELFPAQIEYGQGRAGFAMNRRIFRDGRVDFGENREGPVDTTVPVLRVRDASGAVRAIVFGYACHGTTIGGSSNEEFYAVSGDYMAYARELIEAQYPGAHALYLTGFGGDTNPSPRGSLLMARRHGLELAGAVCGVLDRPMRPVRGAIRRGYRRIALPLEAPPAREQIESDAQGDNRYLQIRARRYLTALDAGTPRPQAVDYPVEVVRIGDDLTFVALGGEVVVDYALRLRRELRDDHPWLVGYAMEVPCYIPSRRLLLEGGYEPDSSLIYYGIYGPFQPQIEDAIVDTVLELARQTAAPAR